MEGIMKCFEIDETFAYFNLNSDKFKGTDGNLKPIPEPLSANMIDLAVANAKRKKLKKLAALMQAERLNAARTQMTKDDIAMAFHLSNS
jgi:hypothetical protein